jgi:hypothetical protein
VLEKNGLAKPNMNFNFGYTWNETSGDTKVDRSALAART